MTSDWGTDGGAELDLNTPVTPKSPGLNPNASVFLSKTPPNNQDNSQWEEESAHSTESTDNFQLVNGDVGKTEGGVAYPPTPESPAHTAEFTTAQESAPNPVAFTAVESNGNIEENGPLEGSIPDDQLRRLLQTQLEYYFSRDNLSHDTYLVSQMDSDQYVPILTVANFNQVKRLTNNMELIVSVLRELANVQVDEKGERVRPNHNRCIVILREVPESTPLKDVENLFSGEKCPKFVSCEFAHNDSWYVTFESDETAQRAYQYLREDVKTFLGKPIMARIKAKTLIRTTIFRNGMKPQYDQQQTYPIQQQQQPPQQQQRFNYPATIQYVNGGQQAFQFPHYNTIMPTWTTMFDPSMVFAINGYQATSVKINQNTGRHNFQSRPRNQKPNRQSSDRSLDNRMSHERYGGGSGGGSHRTSPRSLDGSQSSGGSVYHGRREGGPSQPHIHHPPIPAHLDTGLSATLPLSHPSGTAADNNNKEQSALSQRGQKSYRSRRRREDEGAGGARNSRTNSSQLSSTKDGRYIEPQFELESNSFPPLPGASNNSSTGDIFESKLSDVVKGTARPGQKDAGSKPQAPSPSSPTAKEMNVPAATPASTSNNNNNNTPSITSVAMTTTATTTAPSMSSTVTTTTTGPSVSSLAGSLPTPPPSPEKLDTKTETKHESRFEKSQKATHSHSGPAPNSSHSHAHMVGNKAEVKQVEPEAQPVVKQTTVTTQKSLSLEDKQPVKLSYAQMVQRRSESENGTSSTTTTERPKSEESANGAGTACPASPGAKDHVNHKPHTLKEQSQMTRQSPVNSRLPARDPIRKDSDPKEQRQFVGRRAKENRERRDRRKERELEGRRSPNK
ncbi:la-related protein 4-like [Liolophura sinensis]|uniref:la-related protein 4-like n=1 Tax=Liolophura sinensis TaxID=3198878 RepID=UPI0031591F15